MTDERVSAEFPFQSHFVDVNGSKMHYIEEGQGDPILLLHGIPTSSYLWRNIIPHLAPLGRCIAPDLIGMGKSDKPDIKYSLSDHIKYIAQFIEALNLKRITFVLHGWGSIIGFDYAMKHEKNCKGLVFYEAYVCPVNNEEIALPYQEQMALLQEESADDIFLNGPEFVDTVLPQGMMRTLSRDEMSHYREPFLKQGAGKPLVQYIKELPHDDNETNKIIESYSLKLTKSELPKLMLYSVPGFITTIATVMWAKEHLPHLEVADIGEALHYAQETQPFLMGETISVWLQGIEQQVPIED